MPLFNIFKKKKEVEKKKIKKPKKAKEAVVKKPPKVKVEKKPKKDKLPKEKELKVPVLKSKAKIYKEVWRILKEPHITEKGTSLDKENKYIFKIYPEANKIEVKRAIESLYNVDVLGVRIIKVPPKSRRLGKSSGWRKGYKKAIIKIKKGQKIELLPR